MDQSFTDRRRKDSRTKIEHTISTIHQMAMNGEEISFVTVERRAGVSRRFLYSHETIRTMITDCRITGLKKKDLQTEVIRLRLQQRRVMEAIQGVKPAGNSISTTTQEGTRHEEMCETILEKRRKSE